MTKTRDEILKGRTVSPPQEIDIEEWGGRHKLLPLTGEQAEEIGWLCFQAEQTGNYLCLKGLRGRVATWVVADLDGNRVFQPEDAETLTLHYGDVLTEIFNRVIKTVNFSKDELETLQKN